MKPPSRDSLLAWTSGLAIALPEVGAVPVVIVAAADLAGAREAGQKARGLSRATWAVAAGAIGLLLVALWRGAGETAHGFAPLALLVLYFAGASLFDGSDARALLAGVATSAVVFAGALLLAQAAGLLRLGLHDNIWAARYVLVSGAVYMLAGTTRVRIAAALLALASLLVFESRVAAGGLVLLAILGAWQARPWSKRVAARSALVVGAVGLLAVALLWGTPTGTHLRDLFPRGSDQAATTNLLPSSEDLSAFPWRGVGATAVRVETDTEGTWIQRLVAARTEQGAPRVSAPVQVPNEEPLTLSAEFSIGPGSRGAGFYLWSAGEDANGSLTVTLDAGKVDDVSTQGGLSLLEVSTEVLAEGWLRVTLTFIRDESARGPLLVGVRGPTGSESAAAILVRRPWLRVAAASADRYVPTYPSSASSRTPGGRLQAFEYAWQGFSRSPLVGVGNSAFREDQGQREFVYDHAHDLFLQAAHDTGLLGIALHLLLLAGLIWAPGPGNARARVIVLVAVALNLFDMTFWNLGVYGSLGLYCGLVRQGDVTPGDSSR